TPSTEHFAGDIRVLTRLVEREHEAHTALGDSASLMGTYDVKAEEESIRQVLAGQKELDAVVKTVEEVESGGGLDAFFAQLATESSDEDTIAPDTIDVEESDESETGVYDSEFDFLDAALAE